MVILVHAGILFVIVECEKKKFEKHWFKEQDMEVF